MVFRAIPILLLCSLASGDAAVVAFTSSAPSRQSGSAEGTSTPLNPRGLENLVAFTKLFGYVRHFHPSDQAVGADWDQIARTGARLAESAPDPTQLADTMNVLFQPIAPTLQVYKSGTHPPSVQQPDTRDDSKFLSWRHKGYGGGGSKVYKSERVVSHTRRSDLQVTLGAGVSCRMPLSVSADAIGTLPTLPSETGSTLSGGSEREWSLDQRETRIAGIVTAWNVLQHFYPYFDELQIDWDAALRTALTDAAIATKVEFLNTLRRMMAKLQDGHGNVQVGRQRASIPPVAWEWIEDRVVVTYTTDPRIRRGDALLSIDQAPVAEVVSRNMALLSGASPQWLRSRAIRELASGAPGTFVTLQLERYGTSERVSVRVRRDSTDEIFEAGRPESMAAIEPGIIYVDISKVTTEGFTAAIARLAQAKAIVFDFRGYPRISPFRLFAHLSPTVLTSQQWHIPYITTPDHKDIEFRREEEWFIRPEIPLLRGKKIFIADARAISYAESCLGIVEYYALGPIVGATTAGTNGNTNWFQIPGGVTLSFTGMKVLKHDGSRFHGIGIAPTVPARRTRAGAAAGRDEMLEVALRIASQ